MSAAADTATSCSRRVVVIGAGMAGIKLAHSLLLLQQQDSPFQVTIVEANDYIGGRIVSRDFEGNTVECGANWISGLEETYQNPVWKLAQEIDLQGQRTDRDEIESVLALDATTGTDITTEYMETLKRFDECYEEAIDKVAQQNIRPQQDVDVASLLQTCGWKSDNDQSHIERTVQHNVLDVWVADDIAQLSAAHDMRPGMNDVDLGKEEVFVEDPRGFNSILNGMVDDIRAKRGTIQLKKRVQRVEYSPGSVKVTAKDLESGGTIDYPADIVVCTVSLGVLQSDKITFDPPPPGWKRAAIHEIDMFCFAKVFCKFDSTFQPCKNQFAVCSDKKGHYSFWMRYQNANENLYMCFLGGNEAKRVESLANDKIKSEIQQLFECAFGNTFGNDATVLRPTKVAVTNWSINPYFCGSYSSFPVHAFSKIPESDLTCGLTGTNSRDDSSPRTLYFAGEGFDDQFNGWVQGAYRSGERVAKAVLNGTDVPPPHMDSMSRR